MSHLCDIQRAAVWEKVSWISHCQKYEALPLLGGVCAIKPCVVLVYVWASQENLCVAFFCVFRQC